MKQKRAKIGFTGCAKAYIRSLQEEGRYSTAHVYKNAVLSFTRFHGSTYIAFEQITRESLRRYGQYLYDCKLKLNTISTYMRMLRCIYNRGVEAGIARFIPRLFRDVYTGVDVRQKKAMPVKELHTLLYKTPQSKHLRRTQEIARLMFQFCGMPFADFAHLEKSALAQGVLRYNRILRNNDPVREDGTNYLFSILRGNKSPKGESMYKEYQSALRRFNNQLKSLSRELHLKSAVTSYTIRHSWATNAKYQGIPIEMISESLGHKSIKTTQIYLKGFELEKRTEANRLNCFYVENCNN